MKLNRLTARSAATIANPGRHADGGGLYLSISNDGRRRWTFLYSFGGKRHELGLGSAGPGGVSLADVRRAAADLRAKIAASTDPLDEKRATEAARAAPRAMTFGAFAEDFVATHEAGWKNAKHRQQWRNTLKTYAGSVWTKPLDQIDVEDVLAILTPIWQAKPETASRVRGRLEAILDAARVRGLRPPVENPARWKGNLAALLPKAKKLTRGHHPAMPFDEVREFVQLLRQQDSVSARALELTILTAARSGEVLGMEWSELDERREVWSVPPHRMKSGRLHRVPLTDRARAIIAEMEQLRREDNAFVFPGQRRGRPLSNMAMEMLLRRMQRGDVTVHGMRSSFRDFAGEETHFPREVAEAALAHSIGDATEQAYRRGDALAKRAALMAAWSDFVEGGGAEDAGKVVSLRAS